MAGSRDNRRVLQVLGKLVDRSRRSVIGAVLAPALALTGLAAAPATAESDTLTAPTALHLVTLDTPGTSGSSRPAPDLVAQQDAVLAGIDAPTPVYRWTTALNGFAAELTEEQVDLLRADERVALVEQDAVHPLASARSGVTRALRAARGDRVRGGAGIVVGVVDSGIWPESPLFADTPGLGRAPQRFAGECAVADDWGPAACNRKLVGAQWFVEGFGTDRLRATESLSARDVAGHGTLVASVAAGNGEVSVSDGPGGGGVFSGVAPQARVAAYKACWSAPDPADDGCSAADLVTAVDRATADRVDVLNLAVASPSSYDTLERALLGAAEADVVVTAAAGNEAGRDYAAHRSPWVTTVGGLAGRAHRGAVELVDGPRLVGASRTRIRTDRTRVVLAGRARAAGASLQHARECREGTLDAGVVKDAVVVCVRGGIGRIDKSAAVRRADGAGMVLVNGSGSAVVADLHSVPTVHLDAAAGRRLVRHLRRNDDARGRISPVASEESRARTAPWSASGDLDAAVVKPDLVAPGTGILGAVPPVGGRRWSTFTGTSAAAAHAAGAAALVRSRHRDWDASMVRSALATSTAPVRDGTTALRQGSGRLRATDALRPGLVLRVPRGAYREWLGGRVPSSELNTPSILISRHGVVTRRVTNVGTRAMYYSSRAAGFDHHRVRVEPAALRLRPGQSADFRVVIEDRDAGPHRGDSGTVSWLGAQGTTVRVPVVVAR